MDDEFNSDDGIYIGDHLDMDDDFYPRQGGLYVEEFDFEFDRDNLRYYFSYRDLLEMTPKDRLHDMMLLVKKFDHYYKLVPDVGRFDWKLYSAQDKKNILRKSTKYMENFTDDEMDLLVLDSHFRFDDDYDIYDDYENVSTNPDDEKHHLYELAYSLLEKKRKDSPEHSTPLLRTLSLNRSESLGEIFPQPDLEDDPDYPTAEELLGSLNFPDSSYRNRVSVKNIKIVKELLFFYTKRSQTLSQFDNTLIFFLFNVPKKYSLAESMAFSVYKTASHLLFKQFLFFLKLVVSKEFAQLKREKPKHKIHGLTDCLNNMDRFYLVEFAYYTFKNPTSAICDYVNRVQETYKKTTYKHYRKNQPLNSIIGAKILTLFERELKI